MNQSVFITDEIRDEINNLKRTTSVKYAGRVAACNDGVLLIEGLSKVQNGELLRVSGNYALALNLEEDLVGAILLSETSAVSAGDIAYTTGEIAAIPAGRSLIGRVINPLGAPLDGKDVITARHSRNIEAPAPPIFDRSKVNSPLYTGITAIDSMIPIGKGQRELIIGDRQTGKTALAVDTIINQKGKDVICIYVAIGQKSSAVLKLISDLENSGAMEHTIVVSSTASQPAPLQYLAPYTGTAIAEEFMHRGKDVLIVYDDLSKHAVAYRTISLLLKRPSGREAYPGDIFYIHSKLLERSAKLSAELGGGSLTALPIVETLSGDISAYIPTNVISITDGQIYLESELFKAGVRPAINVGLSVSRVGSAAQCPAMKSVSSKLRLDLAHYRDMKLFARFGADLDEDTKTILGRGERLMECLKQPRLAPIQMADMAVRLSVMRSNVLQKVSVKRISAFLDGFLKYMLIDNSRLFEKINLTGELTGEDEAVIESSVAEYFDKHPEAAE